MAKKKAPLPYRAQDLMEAGGISQRTLSRWSMAGILGPSPRRGPGAGYTEEQMLRARAAGVLRSELPDLETIRRYLDGATRADLETWAKGGLPAEPTPSISAPAAPAAPAYPTTRYELVDLAPGLGLVVRADCDPAVRALAQEIYARYGPGRR
jgi:hypothetical protein